MDSYEVKQFVDKQEDTISNLEQLISVLTFKQKVADPKFDNAIRMVVFQIRRSSYQKGPEGETWPSWKKKPVEREIKYVCWVLGIDIKLFGLDSD